MNQDYNELIGQVIAWFSTLGAGGTLIALKIAHRLTKKIFKLLLIVLIVGIILLMRYGHIPGFEKINDLLVPLIPS